VRNDGAADRYDRPQMALRARIHGLVALALALTTLLVLPTLAQADRAYDEVASAYATAGGHLEPCQFTQAELQAALAGIPPAIRNVVPALRRAMEDGIAAHERGDCRGVRSGPEEGTTGGATPSSTTPATTTPPVTTPPVTTQTAPATPVAPTTTPTTPTTTAPMPASTTTQPATSTGTQERDRTPLVVALVAAGALVLLALLLWGWARMRGWDPGWVARVRHGWGEAGFRTTSTWSEFTDWLRLGR
jgi:cell division septation protein DedD